MESELPCPTYYFELRSDHFEDRSQIVPFIYYQNTTIHISDSSIRQLINGGVNDSLAAEMYYDNSNGAIFRIMVCNITQDTPVVLKIFKRTELGAELKLEPIFDQQIIIAESTTAPESTTVSTTESTTSPESTMESQGRVPVPPSLIGLLVIAAAGHR